MHRHAGRLADRHQPRHDDVGIVAPLGQHLAVKIRLNAAHIVMDRRQHRDGLARKVHAREDACALGDAR